jgi:hypothetical protein
MDLLNRGFAWQQPCWMAGTIKYLYMNEFNTPGKRESIVLQSKMAADRDHAKLLQAMLNTIKF